DRVRRGLGGRGAQLLPRSGDRRAAGAEEQGGAQDERELLHGRLSREGGV
ncbi:MAG: hypothetical protein AVDCRST_MAG68-2994, partial [uncultured Gemmatimonadetes bacterium]